MKKLSFILVLLLILFNCSTDENGSSNLTPERYKLNSVKIDGKILDMFCANHTAKDLKSSTKLNLEGSEANGHFNSLEGHWEISFSSGDDGELGNFVKRGIVNVKGDIICTVVDGNRAVIQVVITKVGDVPEWAEEIFTLGYTLFYLLEDNGEGANAPSDRYWKYLLYWDATLDYCFDLDPDSFIDIFTDPELPQDGEFLDTGNKSDQIQIH